MDALTAAISFPLSENNRSNGTKVTSHVNIFLASFEILGYHKPRFLHQSSM